MTTTAPNDQLATFETNLGQRHLVELRAGIELQYWKSGSGPPLAVADTDVSVDGQADLVARFAEALDLDDVCVIGNDTGGTIAQLVVADHPNRFTSAVLSDCDAFDNLPPTVFKYLCWLARMPVVLTFVMRLMSFRPLLRLPIAFGWLTKAGLPKPVTDYYLQQFQRTGPTRDDLARFLTGVDSTPTRRIANRLPEVKIPVLIAWSTSDRVFQSATLNSSLTRCRSARSRRATTPTPTSPLTSPTGSPSKRSHS